ncbi:MAG: glycosyltransferase family 39 protein, partial [Gemmatimonadota bacterium]|nr:glycosyltransferase family 39 protein [Gemmatimonadota bacterium]
MPTAATGPADSNERTAIAIASVAIVAGIAARTWVWTHRGSLFLDEASLALNVLARGFGGLAHPLDWGQAAPVGYLWVERAAFLMFGAGETALRGWSFVAGVATLPLTWLVARRLAGARAAAFAVTALAGSLLALRYAAEVKPYAGDALAAVGLIWLGLRVHDDPGSARRWGWLGACGVVAVFVSLPSVFTLAAVGVALAGAAWRRGVAARVGLAACGTAWVVAFGAEWFAVLRHSVGDPYLTEYWAPVMLDPSQPALMARMFRAAASVAATPLRWEGSLAAAAAGVGAWACGLAVMARRSRTGLVLLGAPVAFAAAASIAGVYPLSDRLAFFAAPAAMIAVGVALDAVVRPVRPAITVAAVALLAAWVGLDGALVVRSPGSLEPA